MNVQEEWTDGYPVIQYSNEIMLPRDLCHS